MPGQRVVDVGTGTGVLARGFAGAGCTVVGVDTAPELLEQAECHGGGDWALSYRLAPAEDTGLPGAAWDVVSAGQCWHWFDRAAAAAEARRLLTGRGVLVVCYRDFVTEPGNVGAVSIDLARTYNRDWRDSGGLAENPHWGGELVAAGFGDVETFAFDTDVFFTHEEWRGRMRSASGIGAALSRDRVDAFDADLARLLRDRFPREPLEITHRIPALVVRALACGAAA